MAELAEFLAVSEWTWTDAGIWILLCALYLARFSE